MSQEHIHFSPSWEFLENPSLYQLQQTLDSSLSDYEGTEDLRAKCAAFRTALMEYFRKLVSAEAIEETELNQSVEFIHKNFSVLDAGGLSAGRSEQFLSLEEVSQMLIEKIGEQEYFTLVQQYETKTQAPR